MRLGYIDYLNCYPFYYKMFEIECVKGVNILPGLPSTLNKMMAAHELDMSPISSAAYTLIQDDVLLLPDFCLSSIGYVGSVILLSKVPIEELDKKKVGLSSASHTSSVLLKILLKDYYNLEPCYITTPPRHPIETIDAVMLIGNDAMYKKGSSDIFIYDLGYLWLRKTGMPVVFALFAINKHALKKYPSQILSVIESYRDSISCLLYEKGNIVKKAKERYPDVLYDIDNYYNTLKFTFTERLKDALSFYFNRASELGFLRKVDRLGFISSEDFISLKEAGNFV